MDIPAMRNINGMPQRTPRAPDSRQAIADSWPKTIDDSAACEEWGWEPSYDLAAMTEDMLNNLRIRYEAGQL